MPLDDQSQRFGQIEFTSVLRVIPIDNVGDRLNALIASIQLHPDQFFVIHRRHEFSFPQICDGFVPTFAGHAKRNAPTRSAALSFIRSYVRRVPFAGQANPMMAVGRWTMRVRIAYEHASHRLFKAD